MGSVGDSCDNALAKAFSGLFKAAVTRRYDLWRNLEAVGYATPDWVDRFDNRRLPLADREHPAGGSRGKLPRRAGNGRHGRVTNRNQPLANPERFRRLPDEMRRLKALE